MKDFENFKNSISNERINEILNLRISKSIDLEKEMEFEDESDRFVWLQRSQTIGLIFDFLEEYHKWLNE